MLRKVAITLTLLLVLGVVAAGVGLTLAHLAIRGERPALPPLAALSAATEATDLPRSLSVIHTATQRMPRSAVLQADQDPHPDAPYEMTHPSFVLEWADGRILLVDLGMTRDGALSFGKPLEALGMAAAIEPRQPTAAVLGDAARRVEGIVFSHLHIDHVDGIDLLCAAHGGTITVFMNEAQAERPNYTTRQGLERIRAASCTRIEVIPSGVAATLARFPGVAVVAAAGHTPGSQIIAANVAGAGGSQRHLFAGDVINHVDGVTHEVAKPWYYSWFIVPEDRERLAELRRYLHDIQAAGVPVLAAHDRLHIQELGVPDWGQ